MTPLSLKFWFFAVFFFGNSDCKVASSGMSVGRWPNWPPTGLTTWSSWSSWSPCSRSCGQGIQTKQRKCQSKIFLKKTNRCSGTSFQLKRCQEEKCQVTFLSTEELQNALQVEDVLDTTRTYECHTESEMKSEMESNMEFKGTRGADGTSNKWPNKEVPYVLDGSLTTADREVFAKAICDITMHTCVKFKARDGESKFLKVERVCDCDETGGGCFSGAYTNGLGASSNRRLVISSACLSPSQTSDIGLMIHELLHVLGVEHTQKRPDRDTYITINSANIKPASLSQYNKCTSCSTHGTPYDCDSIMHYLSTFFQKPGAGPTMTAMDPATCDLSSYNSVLKPADVELVRAMYLCESGTNLYLYIKGIDDGSHCIPTHKLPGATTFQSGGKIDLKKLYNNPYGGGYKYWTKFGGFGIAAATPFEGCIDDNNQQLMETDAMDVGLLKFSNIQVPGVGGTGWTGSGSWGTSIWINVMSQCQHPGECDAGFGHWWKFEKSLTPSEAEYFAYTHLTPEFADSSVAGIPVVLVYQGQVPCVTTASYGCDPGELD